MQAFFPTVDDCCRPLMPSKSVGIPTNSCMLWKFLVWILTIHWPLHQQWDNYCSTECSSAEWNSALSDGQSLTFPQVSFMLIRFLYIPAICCRFWKSPVWFLNNTGFFPSNGIIALQNIAMSSGCHFLLMVRVSFFLRALPCSVNLGHSCCFLHIMEVPSYASHQHTPLS